MQEFQRLWSDDSGPGGLTIWTPLPPPGYCAVGHVATTDKNRQPPSFGAYCVRDSATFLTTASPKVEVQITPENYDFRGSERPASVFLRVLDNATHALQLCHPQERKQPGFILSLPSGRAESFPGAAESQSLPTLGRPSELPHAMQPEQLSAMQTLAFHLRTSSVCVRVRNILRVPLLEIETAEINVDCDVNSSLVRATANFSPEAWSYNAALKEWEPMLEKFPVKV
jgi:hypothetical protein